jgi:hypothetical protein
MYENHVPMPPMPPLELVTTDATTNSNDSQWTEDSIEDQLRTEIMALKAQLTAKEQRERDHAEHFRILEKENITLLEHLRALEKENVDLTLENEKLLALQLESANNQAPTNTTNATLANENAGLRKVIATLQARIKDLDKDNKMLRMQMQQTKTKDTKDNPVKPNMNIRQRKHTADHYAKLALYHSLKKDSDIHATLWAKLEAAGIPVAKDNEVPWLYIKRHTDAMYAKFTADQKAKWIETAHEKYDF